jgi:hypothetical protein
MRVEVNDEAARMVGGRGGRLWVWDPDAWSARDRAVASRGSAGPGAVAAVRAAELAGGVGSGPPSRWPTGIPTGLQDVRARQTVQDPGPVTGAATCARCTRRRRGSPRLRQLSPHLSTAKDGRAGDWAAGNNVEIAYTPTNSSWLNRIEAQFAALRYFALDGTDHASHRQQASMIRRCIIWRNNHAYDERLRSVIAKADVA